MGTLKQAALDIGHAFLGRIRDLGEPDFTDPDALAKWIEGARSCAFFAGARGTETSKIEAAALIEHLTKPRTVPDAPKLGGGLSPVEWLREIAAIDMKRKATGRAHEAELIAQWIEAGGVK